MAAMGFNSIRLALTWSLLEPQRGRFNTQYLDRIAQVVGWASAAGMYVIIDMHQNAYSRFVGRSDPPAVAGSPAPRTCGDNSGAPAWATITDGLPSETYSGQRELNPSRPGGRETTSGTNRDGIQSEYIATVANAGQAIQGRQHGRGLQPVSTSRCPDGTCRPASKTFSSFLSTRRVIDAVTGVHDGLPCPTQVFMPALCGFPDAGVHGPAAAFLPRHRTIARGDGLSHAPRSAGQLVSEPGPWHPPIHPRLHDRCARSAPTAGPRRPTRGAAMTRPTASREREARGDRRRAVRHRVRQRSGVGLADPQQRARRAGEAPCRVGVLDLEGELRGQRQQLGHL